MPAGKARSERRPRGGRGARPASEAARIRALSRVLIPTVSARGIEVGIGDDAAVIAACGRVVVSVDAVVEGVHFQRGWLTFEDLGFRSLQSAASDLAAMGARPLGAVSSLGLPEGLSERKLQDLWRGQARAAQELGCPVVGGNLSRASELSIVTTVLGLGDRPLLRSGARADDELWLVGPVGFSAAGLEALRRGARRSSPALRACVERWRRPRALIREGRSLVGRAHAAIDISDGLAADARKLADSSRVRVVLDRALLEQAIPATLARAAAALRLDPFELCLFGGEDYALLATGRAQRRPRLARRIGRIEPGRGVVLDDGGQRRRVADRGFDHFAARS